MQIHPVAEMFPMMSEVELVDMSDSIKKEGQLNPCVRQCGVLLDGRNRIAACKIAGVEPKFVEYYGDSPVAFIIGVNLSRRHLDKGQKIALAIEIEPHFAEEAKKREFSGKGVDGSGGRGHKKNPVGHFPQGSHECPDCHNVVSWSPADSPPDEKYEYEQCEECGYTVRVNMSPAPKSRDIAAKAVGISGKLVSAAKAIKAADPVRFEKVKQGKLSVAKAKKEIKAEQDKRELVVAQENITVEKRKSFNSVCDIRVCSCAELFKSGVRPDVVITDPPYPREFLPVFSELAKSCADAGVPVVAVMSGQSYLPEVLKRMCEYLEYRWTIAYLTPGGQAVQQWEAKVNTFWKPVLLFGKSEEWIGDVCRSETNDNDKRFHGWGQSESGMADLINRISKPGQTICDPFVGGGATAIVSINLGRRFVGCDIDADAVSRSIQRCEVNYEPD